MGGEVSLTLERVDSHVSRVLSVELSEDVSMRKAEREALANPVPSCQAS